MDRALTPLDSKTKAENPVAPIVPPVTSSADPQSNLPRRFSWEYSNPPSKVQSQVNVNEASASGRPETPDNARMNVGTGMSKRARCMVKQVERETAF